MGREGERGSGGRVCELRLEIETERAGEGRGREEGEEELRVGSCAQRCDRVQRFATAFPAVGPRGCCVCVDEPMNRATIQRRQPPTAAP